MKDSTKRLFYEALSNGQIIFWEDPGHGWLQVPIDLVDELKKNDGLDVSPYSYKDRKYYYLEEDLDLGSFMNCFPWLNFRDLYQIEKRYEENIFIRNL